MKILRCCLILSLLGLSSTAAFADGVPDPKATMGGGGTCEGTTTFSETAFTQSFTGLQIGCKNDFQNNIPNPQTEGGVTLNMLVVNITSPFTGALTCAIFEGSPLSGFTPTGSSPTSCTFFRLEGDPGIGPGAIYSLQFDNDIVGGGSFGSFVDITLAQTVIHVPEPATMLLFGTGLAVLRLGRKRFKVVGAAG